jgi:hypothetical protein
LGNFRDDPGLLAAASKYLVNQPEGASCPPITLRTTKS